MPRTVKEWVGKTDDARPHTAVLVRIFEAANGLCQKCGIKVGPKQWHADHRLRLRDGGENRETNLQVLCLACHRDKTGTENKLGARALRVKARHIGIKKPTKFPSSREGKWKYNWAKRRYEPVP